MKIIICLGTPGIEIAFLVGLQVFVEPSSRVDVMEFDGLC